MERIATEALLTALRVLTAITNRQMAERSDVEELDRLAPLLVGSPPDEIAVAVIQQALKQRAEARARAAGG